MAANNNLLVTLSDDHLDELSIKLNELDRDLNGLSVAQSISAAVSANSQLLLSGGVSASFTDHHHHQATVWSSPNNAASIVDDVVASSNLGANPVAPFHTNYSGSSPGPFGYNGGAASSLQQNRRPITSQHSSGYGGGNLSSGPQGSSNSGYKSGNNPYPVWSNAGPPQQQQQQQNPWSQQMNQQQQQQGPPWARQGGGGRMNSMHGGMQHAPNGMNRKGGNAGGQNNLFVGHQMGGGNSVSPSKYRRSTSFPGKNMMYHGGGGGSANMGQECGVDGMESFMSYSVSYFALLFLIYLVDQYDILFIGEIFIYMRKCF